MPLPLAAFLSSFFLWLAENIGTRTKTWLYAGQDSTHWVSFAKMGSWYLLLYVSFVTVTLVVRDALSHAPYTPPQGQDLTLKQSPASARQSPRAQ